MHHIFTRTIADVHGGRERPEPKVAGRRERQRGSTSPAEGKGNGATRRRLKGKATGQHVAGRRERQRGSRELWKFLLLMFPLAPVGRGPCGFLPRVPLRLRLRLPWARFLLGLAFSDLRFSPYKSYKVSLLSVDYLQAGCR